MDTGDRLLLLFSMMTLGCPGDDGDDGADEGSDTTTGSTSSPGDTTSVDQDTTGDSTAAADSTSDGGTTMGVATGGTSNGSTDGDSGSGDSGSGDSGDESTTSVEPPSPFVEACVAFYGGYLDCIGKPGYTDEQILVICTEYEGYLEMYYGGECLGPQTEFMSCLSELSCKEIAMDLPPEGELCSKEYIAGNAACPELFSFCDGGAGGGGDGTCTIEAFGCLDGSDYSVQCNATTCTCMIDGMGVGSFDSPGPDACFDDGFGATVETECGFPAGIIF